MTDHQSDHITADTGKETRYNLDTEMTGTAPLTGERSVTSTALLGMARLSRKRLYLYAVIFVCVVIAPAGAVFLAGAYMASTTRDSLEAVNCASRQRMLIASFDSEIYGLDDEQLLTELGIKAADLRQAVYQGYDQLEYLIESQMPGNTAGSQHILERLNKARQSFSIYEKYVSQPQKPLQPFASDARRSSRLAALTDVDMLVSEIVDRRRTALSLQSRVELFMGFSSAVLAVAIAWFVCRFIVDPVVASVKQVCRFSERLELALSASTSGTWEWDLATDEVSWDHHMEALYGLPRGSFPGTYEGWSRHLEPEELAAAEQAIQTALSGGAQFDTTFSIIDGGGIKKCIQAAGLVVRDSNGQPMRFVGLNSDITDSRRLEGQLSQAQKLESIGQLAAGIAHEINTPAQYVGDNTRFMRDEFEGLLRVVDSYAAQLDTSGPQRSWEERSAEIKQTLEQVDYEFVREEIPKAIEQSLEGIDRITRIVRAMKDFSHPGSDEKQSADLNQAIESTVTVCSNRWKYAANLELDLDPSLPAVPCLLGELNQVVLNLVVNAADAIAEHAEDGTKGHIVVSTREEDGHAVITVCDDGPGMPGEVRSKVFDPFFTTKEVGKGTGQGLAISRDVVVQKHGGTIECDSEEGQGTTFTVRLPLTHQSSTKEAA